MKIDRIRILNLRNHLENDIELSDGINIFCGSNGSGKTTVLEAISICSFSRSFLPVKDSSLIRYDEGFWSCALEAKNDYGIPYKIGIKYNGKKEIKSSIGDNLIPKDIIGEIPTVVLTPDYKAITFGAPQDRRDFIDRILSQSNKIYLEEFINLKKILKQRNSLLLNAKLTGRYERSVIESWTEMFVRTSSEIILRRIKFLNEFTPFFDEIYKFVSSAKEHTGLFYLPYNLPQSLNHESVNKENLIDYFSEYSKKIINEEIKRGTTLFGPQKDEIKITVNQGIARDNASQGQHKSLLISLKFAEFKYLVEKKNETPIALLDDIFSELDKERSKKVLELVTMNYAQTFITLTEFELLTDILPDSWPINKFSVQNGIVEKINETKAFG